MAALQVEGMKGKEHACRGRAEVQAGGRVRGRGLESSSLFQRSAQARENVLHCCTAFTVSLWRLYHGEIQGEEEGKANMLNKRLTVRGMDPRLETSLSWEPR